MHRVRLQGELERGRDVVEGNERSRREVVGGTEREHGEGGGRTLGMDQSFRDLAHRAVAAPRDDDGHLAGDLGGEKGGMSVFPRGPDLDLMSLGAERRHGIPYVFAVRLRPVERDAQASTGLRADRRVTEVCAIGEWRHGATVEVEPTRSTRPRERRVAPGS